MGSSSLYHEKKMGQVWCLIVSIHDLCPLSYFLLLFTKNKTKLFSYVPRSPKLSLFPFPLKIWPLIPCSPELNVHVPMLPQPPWVGPPLKYQALFAREFYLYLFYFFKMSYADNYSLLYTLNYSLSFLTLSLLAETFVVR